MIELDKDNFEAETTQGDLPVVVDIWGPQCGPCLALMPKVEELASEFEGRVKFCKLNVAGNRRLVIGLKVMAVPTFLFFRGGERVQTLTGDAVSLEAIHQAAEGLLR